jgi:hypothetical protein
MYETQFVPHREHITLRYKDQSVKAVQGKTLLFTVRTTGNPEHPLWTEC